MICQILDISPRTVSRWKDANLVTDGPMNSWLMSMEDIMDSGQLVAFLQFQGFDVRLVVV